MAYFKKVHPFLQVLIFIGLAFGIFLIVGMIGTVILTKITGKSFGYLADPKAWDLNDPKTIIIVRGQLIIQFLALFILPVFLFARLSDREPGQWLGLRPAQPMYYVLGAIVLVAALPFVDWMGAINHKLIPETTSIGKWMKSAEELAARQTKFLLHRNNIQDLLLNLLFVAVFAGVGEELFFRGVLQRIFIKLFKNAWAGILLAAFLFSAFHFQFYGFIPRFILGILLGAIYWYSGSLWPAIFAHFAYDAFAVIMIYFYPHLADSENVSIPFASQAIMVILSAAVVIGIMIVMKRRSTNSFEAMYARDKIDDSNPFQ